MRVLTRPACGFALLCTVVLATHLTGLFELALRDQTVHDFEHAAYFWSGVCASLPLLAADPLPHPPSAIARFSLADGRDDRDGRPGALLMFDDACATRSTWPRRARCTPRRSPTSSAPGS